MISGSKGQSAIEFMSIIGMSALMIAILHGVMVSKQADLVDYQIDRGSELVASNVAFEIEMALVQGEGYSRSFSIPGQIGGESYLIEVRDGMAVMERGNDTLIVSSRYNGDTIELNSSESMSYQVINDGDVRVEEE